MADAVSELLDQELPASKREQIIGIARGHSQVQGVHDLRARSAGRVDFIELHLELDDHMPMILYDDNLFGRNPFEEKWHRLENMFL